MGYKSPSRNSKPQILLTLRSIQPTPRLLQKMVNVVPLIDLSDFPAESERLREASEGIGCFRIVNHGVPAELIAEMKSVARELLDLPTEGKRRNKDVIPGSGYLAPSAANPFYEALGLYDVGNVHSVEEFCSQLGVSKRQRETIERYAEAIHKVTVDIAKKLARSYRLEEEEFEGWNCQFRINKYNFTQDTVGSPGVQIHTDSGFLTVLQDDENVGGLEVMDRSGSFVAVDPFPGTLAVNLGDIGNVWSNGRLRNVQHRVMCKEATLRFSIATFMAPPKDMVLEAPAVFVDAQHPRVYSAITYEKFRKIRASKEMHAGQALSMVLKI